MTTQDLKIIPCGGVNNVTKNMFIYEYGHDIMVVDCGIGFPDEPGPDQELEIPDFSYLLTNQDKIRGLVISHAHFDHYGAVPHFLEKIKVPVFCSRLSREFIKKKLLEYGLKPKNVDFRIISHKDNKINLGSFKLTPFHVNHSVPQSLGLFIQIANTNIFHVSDYKFDWTPVKEKPFDIQKASSLAAQKKPLLLLSDCLGSTKSGHTESESLIEQNFEKIIAQAKGLVLITTVSSNISRIRQAISASIKVGRKVTFLGRSIKDSANIARDLGYFSEFKRYFVPDNKLKHYPFSKLTMVAAGCYAQAGSALEKLSLGKHQLLKLKESDVVIFSADPSPPGVITNVNKMIDNLTKIGVEVHYYEIQENLYVSGHGTSEDIKMLFALIKPKYLLPIGGDFRYMRTYQQLAQQMGYQKHEVILPEENQVLRFDLKREVIIK